MAAHAGRPRDFLGMNSLLAHSPAVGPVGAHLDMVNDEEDIADVLVGLADHPLAGDQAR